MSNVDAAKIGLAIQRVIRGENLEDMDPESHAIYMQIMANFDKVAAEYDRNREKFIEDSHNEANRPSEREAAKLRNEVKNKFDFYRQQAKMNSAQKKRFLKEHIKKGPFEELYVEPKVVMGRIGEHMQTRTEGQIIGLSGVQMYLPPGLNPKVPKLFAERYRQIARSRKETSARKEILQGKGIDPTGGKDIKDGWQQLAARMNEINQEYESQSGSGEGGDSWTTPDLWQPF